jgi:Spy/CpxP family protein refolding chaperone
MARLRFTFITASAILAVAALTFSSLAQQPPGGGGPGGFGGGRGGGPGGRGPGGPGGFGGFGFGGRGGGSLLGLASNPAVQVELKLSDKQKTQLKTLNDRLQQRRTELRTQMGMGRPGGPGGGGNGNGNGNAPGGPQNARGRRGQQNNNAGGQGGGAVDQGGGAVDQGGGGGFGGGGGGGFAGGGQDPNGGNGQNPGGGRGNRGNGQGRDIDPEQAERFALFQETMDQLQQTGEQSLTKILDKGQYNRLRQVQLQLAGPGVVLREDMVEKLNISDEQIEQLKGFRDEHRQTQREIGKQQREFMKAVFQKANPGGQGNNGQADDNGGNDGNGGNGGNRGNRGNRPRFDPEVMKKVFESPEVKAQMEQNKAQGEKLDGQYALAINKVLYPRQRAALKKMLGAPFDRSKMFAAWGGLPGGNRAAAKNGTASKSAGATAKPNSDDDEEESTSAKAPAKSKALVPAKPSTSPRRKSLRELRGGSSDD